MPETDDPDINVYDMRLTAHEDGWIYGLFCTERKDPQARSAATLLGRGAGGHRAHQGPRKPGSACPTSRRSRPSSATSSCTRSSSTASTRSTRGRRTASSRPARAAASAGRSATRMDRRVDRRGDDHRPEGLPHDQGGRRTAQAPPPIKTPKGWLHLAHGVRNTAAGLRYVLYAFLLRPRRSREGDRTRPAATSSRPRARSASATSRTSRSATARCAGGRRGVHLLRLVRHADCHVATHDRRPAARLRAATRPRTRCARRRACSSGSS